jgi:hypothetical protein
MYVFSRCKTNLGKSIWGPIFYITNVSFSEVSVFQIRIDFYLNFAEKNAAAHDIMCAFATRLKFPLF